MSNNLGFQIPPFMNINTCRLLHIHPVNIREHVYNLGFFFWSTYSTLNLTLKDPSEPSGIQLAQINNKPMGGDNIFDLDG